MKRFLAHKLLVGILTFLMIAVAYAGNPLWTFTQDPHFPAKISVSSTGSATVKYIVTNQSKRAHTLVMQSKPGITQSTSCKLARKGSANSSCQLTLTIKGSALPAGGISGGPVLCQANPNGTPNPTQCYQPSPANSLAITVNNNPSLVSIDVIPASPTIAKGTIQQFIALGTYSDSSVRNITSSVTWSSANTSIATISNSTGAQGRAKGIAPGTATIRAVQGTIAGTARLTVTSATLVSIAVTPTNPTIGVSTKVEFIAMGTYSDSTTQNITNSVIWTSTNTAIAIISNASGSEGQATGIAGGTTSIVATLGSVSGSTSLKVANATLVSIAVTPTNPSIATGSTVQFIATGTYSDSTTQNITNSVTWSSSNTSIATISNLIRSEGSATGIAAGTTSISATLGSVSGTTSLKVTNATLVSIAVTPTNPSIAVGSTVQFIATGTYSDATTQNITNSVIWTSSNSTTATISNVSGTQGRATSLAVGNTIVKATLGTVSGTTNLNVTNATLVSIEITPINPSLAAGTTIQFIATGTYSDSTTHNITNTVTWTSSNAAAATISNAIGSEGRATSIAMGTTNIQATLGSISSSTNLNVTNATLVSIAVTPTNPSIAAGTTVQFIATGTYSDSTTQNLTNSVTWTSSNTTTATVSNASGTQGRVNGLSAGTTTIKASLGAVSGSTLLNVTNATLVSIAVTPTNPSIALGTTIQFIATGTYSDSTTQNITNSVTWSSSNSATATISNVVGSEGKATSIAAGAANIKAVLGAISGSTTLGVTSATLVSIAVTPTTPSIAAGTSVQFIATGTYSDSTTQNITNSVTWSSSDTDTAAISNVAGIQGRATGIAPGTATIKATSGAIAGNTTLSVTNATLVSIAISPINPTIALGATMQFIATGTYSDSSTQNITNSVIWSSSNPSTATISNVITSEGRATSVAPGQTTLIATLGTISGTTNLTVTPAILVSIAVTPTHPSIPSGTTEKFTAIGTYSDSTTQNITTAVTWSSSVPSIATISNAAGTQGIATGIIAGNTTITATSGSVSGTAILNVLDADLVSIAITPVEPSIAFGTSIQFTATGTYTNSTTRNITDSVTWSSSDIATATISNVAGTQGKATSVAPGSTTITATLGSFSSTTPLTVTNAALVSIAITPTLPSIAPGTAVQFTATGTYTDSTMQNITNLVTWSSSNASSATISNLAPTQGLANGLAAGTSTITATLGSVSSTTTLNITNASLVSIAIVPTDSSIAAGTTTQFNATGTYSDSTTQNITNVVTWSSSDTSEATISNAIGSIGLAAAVSPGDTTITATKGSLSNNTPLHVTDATLVSIFVSPPAAQIAAGTTVQYTATGVFSNGYAQNLTNSVTWSSSNPSSAIISNSSGTKGLATSTSSGTTTITATLDSVFGTTSLNVTNATLVSIAVTPTNPSVSPGTSVQFIATGTYSDATTQNISSLVTWASSDQNKATISNAQGSNGLATGVTAGSTTIIASMGSIFGNTGLTVITAPMTTLQTSLTSLALSVMDPAINPALTGTPRNIQITNNGTNTALNVTYSLSTAWPEGSGIVPTDCGNIAPGDSCVLTIFTGSIPSATAYNLNPTPIILTLSGGNTNTLTSQINILAYGSVYQGGYVYAIDDNTPPTESIGGRVVAFADQNSTIPNGIVWSTNVDSIFGISSISTTSEPNPSSGQVTGQLPCDGNSDGACNSRNIVIYYSPPTTTPQVPYSDYAAGLCQAQINNYSEWYLPAICEMGPSTSGGCLAVQNIRDNLPSLIGINFDNDSCPLGINCLSGAYWSSTGAPTPQVNDAWGEVFNTNVQSQVLRFTGLGVRCTRTLTH